MVLGDEITRIESKLEEHESRISKLEHLFQAKPENIAEQVSVKEFVLQKEPKDDVQRTLAIGYYLERYKALRSFNVKDLETGFRDAKQRVPNNINLCVIANINKNHMMEAKEKKDKLKAWVLTSPGEKHVENDFEKEQ
jgi:hypothetical protein